MSTKPFDHREAKLTGRDPRPGDPGALVRVVTITFMEDGIMPKTMLMPTGVSILGGSTIKLLTKQIGTVSSVVVCDRCFYDSKLR